jgi:hypothetical protein
MEGLDMPEIRNPFSYDRFEKEEDPAIYLPRRFERFKTGRNFYFRGSRGTGKTALLRSFYWRDRITDSSFRMSPEDFRKETIIGLYVRVPDYQVPEFKQLSNNEEFRNNIFSTYLTFIHLELLFDALSNLSRTDYLPISASNELVFCRNLVQEYASLFSKIKNSHPIRTFHDLKSAFHSLQTIIRIMGIRNLVEQDYPDVFLISSFEQFYGITQRINSQVKELNEWRFFLCIDEAEAFHNWQQVVLNTLVRTSKRPWTYLIAFVEGAFDLHKTAIPNESLGDADRIVEKLDGLEPGEFSEFADGILKKRIEKARGPIESLDVESILGKYTVNELLANHLKKSTRKGAEDLLKRAEDNRFRYSCDSKEVPPPIYETWIETLQNEQILTGEESQREKRRISSSKLRKRHLASYHNICVKFHFKPVYAGKDAILSLSDQCVRDFLRFFFFLFEESRDSYDWNLHSLEIFDKKIQNKAVLQAAKNKLNNIEDEVIYETPHVRNLVDNIGNLLRAHMLLPKSALDPDRGIIRIPIMMDLVGKDLKSALEEARYCGVIHVEEKSNAVELRLHCILNAYFKLPYRRPERKINVDLKYAQSFIKRNLSSTIIERILRKISTELEEGSESEVKGQDAQTHLRIGDR